jgi:hypothetical protein
MYRIPLEIEKTMRGVDSLPILEIYFEITFRGENGRQRQPAQTWRTR